MWCNFCNRDGMGLSHCHHCGRGVCYDGPVSPDEKAAIIPERKEKMARYELRISSGYCTPKKGVKKAHPANLQPSRRFFDGFDLGIRALDAQIARDSALGICRNSKYQLKKMYGIEVTDL